MLHVASCFSRAYFFFLLIPRPPISTSTDTLFPYSTLFRSGAAPVERLEDGLEGGIARIAAVMVRQQPDSLGAERIAGVVDLGEAGLDIGQRSEEHTSELQSPMRISYAVFCLKKQKHTLNHTNNHHNTNYTPKITIIHT